MDPRMIPKGSSPEYNYGEQDGKARPNEPGVYYHPQANKFMETTGQKKPDGSMVYARDAGKIQGDAFVQLGFRQADEQEKRYYREAQTAANKVLRVKNTRTTVSLSSTPRR